ncbi:MAG: hypothetical protein JHC31_13325 [Sulfurihydrogenibium sp.]|jgi:hypothetical protein|nr:hypothetical protein [Sulfurihydrogenibium sp.]
MARPKTKKELAEVYDVVREILENQPANSEIEIVFEKTDNRRLLQIKGDKAYVLLSYENNPTKLFIDGDVIRDDIKPMPKKGMVSDIESLLYWNSQKFELIKHCKDLMTDKIIFVLKRKGQ